MNKVITFLDVKGALSCAAFLNKFPSFDISVCSTNNFSETLYSLCSGQIEKLVILGAGPGPDNSALEKVSEILENLLKKDVIIDYFAKFNISLLKKRLSHYKNLNLIYTEKELYIAVKDFYSCDKDHINFLEKNSDKIRLGVDEAKFRFFNFENRDFYPDFLRNLSKYIDFNPIRECDHNTVYYNQKFLFGKSDNVRKLKKQLEKVGEDSFCNVLISGESGTGKTTLAYSLHYISSRKGRFEVISCANFQETLLESKLFGWNKGAFTDAKKDEPGLFEIANGGTLFLDEIGEMPIGLQSKLLRVLQDGKFKRVGGSREITVDVRVIAATNRNLKDMIERKEFRADLFYRIAAIELTSIPLREQIDDIGYISNFLLREIYQKRNRLDEFKKLDEKTVDILKKSLWPGNVRQLQNALERAVILDEWDFGFLSDDCSDNVQEQYQDNSDDIVDLETMKREYILKVFNRCGRNITRTAEVLDVSKNTVKSYIRK